EPRPAAPLPRARHRHGSDRRRARPGGALGLQPRRRDRLAPPRLPVRGGARHGRQPADRIAGRHHRHGGAGGRPVLHPRRGRGAQRGQRRLGAALLRGNRSEGHAGL
ncbi:MAG: Uncharacterized protein PA0131, partial [uncultured Acetobacteraceae bacterium]